MFKEILIKNSNALIFIDKNKILNDFSILKKYPDVVMLSSWSPDLSNYNEMRPLIEKLLDSGCKYFVCVGEYSESLHDFIDDLILGRPINSNRDKNFHVMTTWHDTDTEEEVVDFFLYLTNVHDSILAAVLEDGKQEDDKLKSTLLKEVGSSSN